MTHSTKNGSGQQTQLEWEDDKPQGEEAGFSVDVAGYEGPLDLLLQLARQHKIDLAKISMLALVEQYLVYIRSLQNRRIEVAADYLVMAAWLAYLKSRLLIPQTDEADEEPDGEELAAQLAFRLKRLEAMREAAANLVNRNRLNRDFFARGMPESMKIEKRLQFDANLFDLLTAYANRRQQQSVSSVTLNVRKVWSLKQARELLTHYVGRLEEWTALDSFLLEYIDNPQQKATALASAFAATLELVREGTLAINQKRAFGPVLIKHQSNASEVTHVR